MSLCYEIFLKMGYVPGLFLGKDREGGEYTVSGNVAEEQQ